MKYCCSLLTLLLVALCSVAFGQTYIFNDTLYVWEMRGANVIKTPAPDGQILSKSYYGSAVRVVDKNIGEHPATIEIQPGLKVQGHWIKVIVKKDTGYIFDGYLSHFKTFDLRSDASGIDLAYENFPSDALVSKDIRSYEPGNVSEGQSRDIRFENGIRWNLKNIENCLLETYHIPTVRYAEAYQLMMALYSNYFDQKATYMSEPEFLQQSGLKHQFVLRNKDHPLRISLYHQNGEYIISSYSCTGKAD